MGRKQRIHFSKSRKPGEHLWECICGALEITATSDVTLVTCRRCIKKLHKTDIPIRQQLAGELRAEVDELESLLDPESGLPVLKPATYQRRDCTCGQCAICKHIASIERDEYVAPWADRPGLHRQRVERWTSLDHALAWYADQRDDGYQWPSSGMALEILNKMGVIIASRVANDHEAIRDADDRSTMEAALRCAVRGEQDVLPDQALSALFAASVGFRARDPKGRIIREPVKLGTIGTGLSLSAKAVGNLVRRVRGRLYGALRHSSSIPEVRRISRDQGRNSRQGSPFSDSGK